MNSTCEVLRSGRGHGYVWIENSELVIYSCYISPNVSIETFNMFLYRLKESIGDRKKKCLICGDFNAKSAVWGSPVDDKRGDELMKWSAELDLAVLNNGTIPTFCRGKSTSYIDITLAASKVAKSVANWAVSEEENLTDHNYIFFEVTTLVTAARIREESRQKGWKIDEAKMEAFQDKLGQNMMGKDQNSLTPQILTRIITETCNQTFKKRVHPNRKKKPVYWWSPQIAQIRKDCLTRKRIMTRTNRRVEATEDERNAARNQYKEKRNCLKKAILKAKQNAWKEVLEEVENDTWGNGYKLVTKKFCLRPPARIPDQIMIQEAERLFPHHRKITWEPIEVHIRDIPLFTKEELSAASTKLKPKKAPGPDNIPPEIIQSVANRLPDECLNLMNHQLKIGEFPKEWKIARLVLLKKPPKPDQVSPSYRPLCLLDCMGKMLEHLLKSRLNSEIERNGGMSPTQYGFTKGKSTVDAMARVMAEVKKAKDFAWQNKKLCLLVTLDVKNAFNSAPWEGIVDVLGRRNISPYLKRMITSYLSDRKLIVGDEHDAEVTCGVPQGSVLGPLLWNIYYDEVLTLDMPQNVLLVGYADDLAVVVTEKSETMLVTTANIAIQRISEWMETKKLKLAPEKTEAVLLNDRKEVRQVNIEVQSTEIRTAQVIKYLGVFFDKGAKMKQQVINTCKKAENSAMALCRLMPNAGGPSSSIRRLLGAVTHSIMLYAAPIWQDVLTINKYRLMLQKVQRRISIRICSAFRTVSSEVVLLLAVIIPIDLQAQERTRVLGKDKGVKLAERETTLNTWQIRWNEMNDSGQWTKELIPADISLWCKSRHGELNYYLTQLLTGHGCFERYFHRFKINETPNCHYCGEVDDTRHTFFICRRWEMERRAAETLIGETLTPNNLVQHMLRSQATWTTVSNMAKEVLRRREEDRKTGMFV